MDTVFNLMSINFWNVMTYVHLSTDSLIEPTQAGNQKNLEFRVI
jgi:hypothetical protein